MEFEQIYMLARDLLNRTDPSGLEPGYGNETSAPIDEFGAHCAQEIWAHTKCLTEKLETNSNE